MGVHRIANGQTPVQRDEPGTDAISVNRGQGGVFQYRGPAKRYLCEHNHLVMVGNFVGWVQPWCHKCDKAVDLFESDHDL